MSMRGMGIAVVVVASLFGGAHLQAGTVTWTGGSGGSGSSWNDPANWGGTAPGTNDTAVFSDTGITNNKVISLDASQAVYAVTISTIKPFMIGSANDMSVSNALTLVNVVRQDVSGTEGTHTIRAPVVLASNSTWTVDGSAALVVTNQINGGSYSLTKDGLGELDMSVANSYATTYVLAGTLKARVSVQIIPGDVVVGGGTSAATFDGTVGGNVIAGSGTVIAKTNGTAKVGGNENLKAFTTFAGGLITCYYPYLTGTIQMTGGTISGGGDCTIAQYNQSSLYSYATNSMAWFAYNLGFYAYGNYTISVEDGAAPVDLRVNGLQSGGAGYSFTKSGPGVLEIMNGSTYANKATAINAGTVLADCGSGSATATSAVTVAAGATLGGTGFVGGVTGNGGVSLTSAASTNTMATLWPGTIDPTSGAHIIGTLTIGSASVSNNVTFGKFTRLSAQLGSTPGTCDRLAVNGYLNLNTAANTNYLDVGFAGAAARPGDYTLVTFSALTGRFYAVRSAPGVLPNRYYLRYLGTPSGRGNELLNGSVVLSLPSPVSIIMMR